MKNIAIATGIVSIGWFSWIMIQISLGYHRINKSLHDGTPVPRVNFDPFPFGITITAILWEQAIFTALFISVVLLHTFWAKPPTAAAPTGDERAATPVEARRPAPPLPDSASARDAALIDLYARYRNRHFGTTQDHVQAHTDQDAQAVLRATAELLRNPHALPAELPEEYRSHWERETAEIFTVFAYRSDQTPPVGQ